MAKKKISPLRQEFKKQQKRILDFMRRAKKRGYTFKGFDVPDMPERVTKAAVERLKELTAVKLYARAQYVIPESKNLPKDFAISGLKGRQIERKEAAQKAKETKIKKEREKKPPQISIPPGVKGIPDEDKIILDALKGLIDKYPSAGATYMDAALEYQINKYGIDKVAAALNNIPSDILEDAEDFLFDSDGNGTSTVSSALRKLTEAIKQEVLKADEMKELNRIMNQFEGD